MPSPNSLFLLFALLLLIPLARSQNDTVSCPLDFTPLRDLLTSSAVLQNVSRTDTCQYVRQGLRLVESYHLLKTGYFLPPANSSVACWAAYESLLKNLSRLPANFTLPSSCGFESEWIATGCMNVSTRAGFETLVPVQSRSDAGSKCNQSLENNSPCAACTSALSTMQASYLSGESVGNVSDCSAYPAIYAAAFLNYLGPTDKGNAKCLFLLDFTAGGGDGGGGGGGKVALMVVTIGLGFGLVLLVVVIWLWIRRRRRRRDRFGRSVEIGPGLGSGPGPELGESTNVVKYTFEEIKKATKSFSRNNIVGRGGYGNVYKGELSDGSQVAVKRFKNCSVAGDPAFVHEVEMIASVRHVNLLSLRGYCTATTQFEGHQRLIVCDLIRNGSLHDHLFGSARDEEGVRVRLSWPIRQKIALGTAKGLAYLHYGAQPAIIHRDIKASNILIDERFEPKVADFGLARIAPEGMTHVSTRVAGTMGYVAPEYALYGQLTERSDVYSFGVVLLELLSGRKALTTGDDGQPLPVVDWAWSLVRQGRPLDVLEDGIPELGREEIMEQYVMVAVLCSHPQLYARPTMDQVVKMLETEVSVPAIPDRQISLVAEMDDIERSVSSSGGSGQLSTSAGYQSFMLESDHPSGSKGEGSSSDSRIVELL